MDLDAIFKAYDVRGMVPDQLDDEAARRIGAAFASLEQSGSRYGLTVVLGDRWFNLRPSNTEPVLRLNVEAPDAGAVAELVASVTKTIEEVSDAVAR